MWVHPENPDVVYVGAQGNPWGPNEERGMYRSTDGGETWEKIFYVSEDAGIVDMSVNAENPRIMMATSWDFRRRPWVVKSGGPGSGVWKTTDGGESVAPDHGRPPGADGEDRRLDLARGSRGRLPRGRSAAR